MGVFATLNGAMARSPLAAAMVVTTGKAALADIMTQTIIEGTPPTELDKRRALLFAAFGFGYQGCAQYYMYSKLYHLYLYLYEYGVLSIYSTQSGHTVRLRYEYRPTRFPN